MLEPAQAIGVERAARVCFEGMSLSMVDSSRLARKNISRVGDGGICTPSTAPCCHNGT